MMKTMNNFSYFLRKEDKIIDFDPKSMANVSNQWFYIDQQKTRFGNSLFTRCS